MHSIVATSTDGDLSAIRARGRISLDVGHVSGMTLLCAALILIGYRLRLPVGLQTGLWVVGIGTVLATGFGYACPIGRIAFEVEPEMERIHARVAANFAGWSAAIHENLEAARDRRRLAVAAGSRPAPAHGRRAGTARHGQGVE